MRNKVLQAQLDKMPLALCPSSMLALLEMANSETPRAEYQTPKVANESVVYEKRGSIAIISIDGGMYKKDIGGLCGSVASYDKMVKFMDMAENDDEVKTIIHRVDSPGGAVHGVDEVEAKIASSKKETITFYENIGASGAIWAFSASKKIYASEATMLGSIGVVVSYMEEEDDSKRIEIVSKNAPNKRCSLNGDCKEKITAMINTYEDMFYARVEKNTGFSAEKIKSTFDNGGMIFATEALKAGFIQGITTFDSLLKSLKKSNGSTYISLEANPTASGDNSKKNNTGADMKFDREDLDATEEAFKVLVANRDTLTNRNETLKTQLQTMETALEAKNEELNSLKTESEAKLSEAEGKLAEIETRVEEAMAVGADAKTILAMVKANSAEDASKIALDAKESSGASAQSEFSKQEDPWENFIKEK